ncbi:uncharacterized protein LOC129615405 isoform X2 [Condylostylus longicornis]|uniref:uncharacterized protein LOC129615405 isoform X2 n=1 Tax=Condylostylus longicornis TaxID=2530218 RepID=UPI00244E30FE|nr:uncharacterized protein LOC129615405 isoform X2 [Condylostylus longicornis]
MAYKNLDNTEFRKLHDENFRHFMYSRLALYFNNFNLRNPPPQQPQPPPQLYPEPLALNLPSSSSSSLSSPILFSTLNHNLKEWYLIQQEPNKILLLINRSDLILINNNTSIEIEKQIYSKIKFQRNNIINVGRIINFSNDRFVLEQELRKRLTNIIKINSILTKCNFNESEKTSVITSTSEIQSNIILSRRNDNYVNHEIRNNSWFLVQFERNENCIVYSIIDTRKFLWNLNNTKYSNNQDLYILDENYRRKVIILYASNNRNDVLNQLSFLISKVFNLSFKDPESCKRYQSWLLIQYTVNHTDFIYDIVNESDTIYKRENLNPNVVTYVRDDNKNILYQAIILKRSLQHNELEIDLENIRTASLFSLFPLEQENSISNIHYKLERCKITNDLTIEYLNFSRSTQTDFYYPANAPLSVDVGSDTKDKVQLLDEQPDYTSEELKLIRKLNIMEENMHKESHSLRNTFYQLERISTNMDREIMTLEYLLSLPDIL